MPAERTYPRRRMRYSSSVAGSPGRKWRQCLASGVLQQGHENFFQVGPSHFELRDRDGAREFRKVAKKRRFLATEKHLGRDAFHFELCWTKRVQPRSEVVPRLG